MQNSVANGSFHKEMQEEIVMRRVEDNEPLALYVYKTMTDPFTGRVTFFKVVSGKMKADSALMNYTRQESEALGHLYVMLSGGAVDRINASELDQLVVTDTIPLNAEAAKCPKIRALSCSGLLAETFARIRRGDSVMSLFADQADQN